MLLALVNLLPAVAPAGSPVGSPAGLSAGLVHGAADPGFALLPQPGPDSPFGDLLGWVIVFFVVVWPILRGLLDTAKKQREEFEKKQGGKGAGQARAGAPARKRDARRTLEELLEGRVEALREFEDEDEPQVAPPRRRKKQLSADVRLPEKAASTFGERPDSESAAPDYSEALVGDPFDESTMSQDLVPNSKLREVPAESEIESRSQPGGQDGDIVERKAMGRSAAAVAESHVDGAAAAKDPEAIFRRLERPLSPWQKAFILKEVLGSPLASRAEPALDDLID